MATGEETMAQTAKPITEVLFRVQEGTVRAATERAYTCRGPSLDDLEVRGKAQRYEFMAPEDSDENAVGRD